MAGQLCQLCHRQKFNVGTEYPRYHLEPTLEAVEGSGEAVTDAEVGLTLWCQYVKTDRTWCYGSALLKAQNLGGVPTRSRVQGQPQSCVEFEGGLGHEIDV